MRVPEAPQHVQQENLDKAITAHRLEVKEWDMWELLSSHGLVVDPPEGSDDDDVICPPSAQPPHIQGFSDKTAAAAACSEGGIFEIDL